MSYRWQETIKILIPGFYILICVGLGCLITYEQIDKDFIDLIGKISAVLIILMFFTAFVVGYINEIISSIIELILYKIGLPRPSRLVLNNKIKRFRIVRNDELRQKLDIMPPTLMVDNSLAAISLAKAKQATESDKYQELYYQSVLARNLCFAHLVSCILLLYVSDCPLMLLILCFPSLILFCWQWWKMNLVYVKKIFLEYLK